MQHENTPPEQSDEDALDQEAIEITAKTAKIDASTINDHTEQTDEAEIASESELAGEADPAHEEAEKSSDAVTAIWIAPNNSFYRDYWKEFRLFGSSFEEWSFRYWYLVPLAFFVLLLIIDVNLDLRQGIDLFAALSQGSLYAKAPYSFTLHDITSTYLLFALVAFLGTGFTFDRWGKSIPILLWRLYTLGRIFSRTTRQKVTQEEYLRFLARYQQALLGWKRFLFLGVALLLTLALLVLVVPAQLAAVVASPAPDGFFVVL